MSDEFDKEAEREKLREKLADDDEKREHTQRMSELLLKGATMTNRHCDDCGDPIFRQDGQEFCPTCHTVDAADVQGEAGTATRPADGRTNPQHQTRTDPKPEAVDGANGEPAGTRPDESAPGPSIGGNGTARSGRGDVAPGRDAAAPSSAAQSGGSTTTADGPEPATAPDPLQTPAGSEPAEHNTVADARASLTRTLTRFARAAEATDDPRRASEHLRAAREAAETLSALDR